MRLPGALMNLGESERHGLEEPPSRQGQGLGIVMGMLAGVVLPTLLHDWA